MKVLMKDHLKIVEVEREPRPARKSDDSIFFDDCAPMNFVHRRKLFTDVGEKNLTFP